MHAAAIIVAAGRGRRLGGVVPKQVQELSGRTMLEHSIAPFETVAAIREIVVVLPSDLVASPPAFLRRLRTPVRVVEGGARRQDSVAAGFDAVTPHADLIVIHDAARPFCTPELVGRTLEAATASGAAIAAIGVPDTVKEAEDTGDGTFVTRTLPRVRIFLAQTPQAFTRSVLTAVVALGRSGVEGTDEASLAEQAGHRVRLVEGDPLNMKVTTESDLTLAQRMAQKNEHSPMPRVGLGYDLHQVVPGRPLILGGVTIPGDRGLLGHSDADVVCHAVGDAVLGAANAGDIGEHFPDDDPRWKDASSIDLLHRVGEIVRERGFEVENADIVVITDWPKIRDYANLMTQRLSQALQVAADRVTIKGKTSEGVGPVGRGEAIVVHAVALLRRSLPVT